jgi:flagellar motor switch protein FliM
MSAEILQQDEIDALLNAVDSDKVKAAGGSQPPGEAKSCDLATLSRAAPDYMPALEVIYERFARLTRQGLGALIRRAADVAVKSVGVQRFGDYAQTLPDAASLNIVKIEPLRGAALIVVDPRLVSAVVDYYFGGSASRPISGAREFTAAENRIIQLLLSQAYGNFQEAWSHIAKLQIGTVGSGVNPQFANIASPSEVVVCASFSITIDDTGGKFDIVMPCSMLEMLRGALKAGNQVTPSVPEASWTQALREEVEEARVELVPLLGHANVTLKQLVDFKPGDVIPCDFDGQVTLVAEGIPVLRGTYGASRGQQSVKVTERLVRRKPAVLVSNGAAR